MRGPKNCQGGGTHFLPSSGKFPSSSLLTPPLPFPIYIAEKASKNLTNEQFQNFDLITNLSSGPCRWKFFLQFLSYTDFVYFCYWRDSICLNVMSRGPCAGLVQEGRSESWISIFSAHKFQNFTGCAWGKQRQKFREKLYF